MHPPRCSTESFKTDHAGHNPSPSSSYMRLLLILRRSTIMAAPAMKVLTSLLLFAVGGIHGQCECVCVFPSFSDCSRRLDLLRVHPAQVSRSQQYTCTGAISLDFRTAPSSLSAGGHEQHHVIHSVTVVQHKTSYCDTTCRLRHLGSRHGVIRNVWV